MRRSSSFRSLTNNTFLYDIDRNKYKSVIVGTQEILLSNLRVTHYADGTIIPNAQTNDEWTNGKPEPIS
jgi:hypothetical protein